MRVLPSERAVHKSKGCSARDGLGVKKQDLPARSGARRKSRARAVEGFFADFRIPEVVNTTLIADARQAVQANGVWWRPDFLDQHR